MKDTGKTVKQESLLIAVFVALVVGFILGIVFAVYKLDSSTSNVKKNRAAETSQKTLPGQQTQALLNLEEKVKAEPKNIQAWVQLGHLYFDTGQAEKAIGAYTTSLTLHDGDANLYTDLGVMYRRTGKFEKAIEMFEKATAMNPSHEPSRLNKGIVQMFDLGKNNEAIATWEELLKINPKAMAANGELVSDFIDHVKKDLETRQKNK